VTTGLRTLLVAAIALGCCLSHPLSAQAPAKVFRLGILAPSQQPDVWETVRDRLRSLGYSEGKNLLIEERDADGDYGRLPALADELVKLRVDVIATATTPGLAAAEKATRTIPIVFAAGDPVTAGLVHSLAKPGVNATGVSMLSTDILLKQAELLIAARPNLSQLAVLINPANPSHADHLKVLEAAAPIHGSVGIVAFKASTPAEIQTALQEIAKQRIRAVLWFADPFLVQQIHQIAETAAAEKLPSIGFYAPMYAEAGGLMAYGPDRVQTWRQVAEYVDRIFRGANPADLPVQQPTRLLLTINKATAKTLGLTIPPELLLQADKVIE
jgi:putative ABC transport system substrate-binding protein